MNYLLLQPPFMDRMMMAMETAAHDGGLLDPFFNQMLVLLHTTNDIGLTCYLVNATLHVCGLGHLRIDRPLIVGVETTERLDLIQALRARGIYQ